MTFSILLISPQPLCQFNQASPQSVLKYIPLVHGSLPSWDIAQSIPGPMYAHFHLTGDNTNTLSRHATIKNWFYTVYSIYSTLVSWPMLTIPPSGKLIEPQKQPSHMISNSQFWLSAIVLKPMSQRNEYRISSSIIILRFMSSNLQAVWSAEICMLLIQINQAKLWSHDLCWKYLLLLASQLDLKESSQLLYLVMESIYIHGMM